MAASNLMTDPAETVLDHPGTQFRTLLVPLDGSPLAERALPYAETLAGRLRAKLILVRSACAPPPKSRLVEHRVAAIREAQEYLEKQRHRLDRPLSVQCAVPYGDPANEIANVAKLRSADLIIMATHGRGGVGRMLMGSVADSLVRQTNLPVLLVSARSPAAGWERGLRRILVALDGSELAESMLPRVAALAHAAKAQITLLRVVSPLPVELSAYEISYPIEADQALAEEAGDYLKGIAAPLVQHGIEVRTRVEVGSPASLIGSAAAEDECDLIALATRGRGGVERLILGSVAQQLIQDAHVPVLLFRGP